MCFTPTQVTPVREQAIRVEAQRLGLEPLEGELHASINASDSLWVVEDVEHENNDGTSRKTVSITLAKSVSELWPRLFQSEEEREPRLLDGADKNCPPSKWVARVYNNIRN